MQLPQHAQPDAGMQPCRGEGIEMDAGGAGGIRAKTQPSTVAKAANLVLLPKLSGYM